MEELRNCNRRARFGNWVDDGVPLKHGWRWVPESECRRRIRNWIPVTFHQSPINVYDPVFWDPSRGIFERLFAIVAERTVAHFHHKHRFVWVRTAKVLFDGTDECIGLRHAVAWAIRRQLNSDFMAGVQSECHKKCCSQLSNGKRVRVILWRHFDQFPSKEIDVLPLKRAAFHQVVVFLLGPAL
ncbi:MAG: hypothetical protein JWN40_1451 [Phycisphaerales bacterium]|nr:hypothetical protein [Phycisphaerales bacterium]